MSEQKLITRRDLLRRSVTLSVGAAGVAILASACKGAPKEMHCDDTTGLAPVDISTRKALEYVDRSTLPDKSCTNCAQLVPAANETTCAGCKMFKGGVHPKGYCKGWAAKT